MVSCPDGDGICGDARGRRARIPTAENRAQDSRGDTFLVLFPRIVEAAPNGMFLVNQEVGTNLSSTVGAHAEAVETALKDSWASRKLNGTARRQ